MTMPGASEELLHQLRRIYEDAEESLLRSIARRLSRGIDREGWDSRKLNEIRQVRREVEREMASVARNRPNVVDAVDDAYRNGSNGTVRNLQEIGAENIRTEFGQTHRRAVARLTEEATNLIDDAHAQARSRAPQAYGRIVREASAQAATGTRTRLQAAQSALNRFSDQGITSFVDKAGRRTDIASYVEMATRTTLGQAQVQGTIDRFQENNRDLVIVSVSPESCPICSPHEGRVYSLSGRHQTYPPLQEARGAGLFHANCVHTVGAFVPGLSREVKAEKDPQQAQRYREREKQRYNERNIRKYKKREAAAMTDDAAEKARRRRRAWQAENRRHVERTGRRRKYERESITTAR